MITYTIGSSTECDIVVDRATVCPRHCRLLVDGRRYLLEDLESEYGTFVNGSRINDIEVVTVKDEILVGRIPMPWPESMQDHRPVTAWIPWAVCAALAIAIFTATAIVLNREPAELAGSDPTTSDNENLETPIETTTPSDDQVLASVEEMVHDAVKQEEPESPEFIGEAIEEADDVPLDTAIENELAEFFEPTGGGVSISGIFGQDGGGPGNVTAGELMPNDNSAASPLDLLILAAGPNVAAQRLWTDNVPQVPTRPAFFEIGLSGTNVQEVVVTLIPDNDLEIAGALTHTFPPGSSPNDTWPVQVIGNGGVTPAEFAGELSLSRPIGIEISSPAFPTIAATAVQIELLDNSQQKIVFVPPSQQDAGGVVLAPDETVETNFNDTTTFTIIKTQPSVAASVALAIPENAGDIEIVSFADITDGIAFPVPANGSSIVLRGGRREGPFSIMFRLNGAGPRLGIRGRNRSETGNVQYPQVAFLSAGSPSNAFRISLDPPPSGTVVVEATGSVFSSNRFEFNAAILDRPVSAAATLPAADGEITLVVSRSEDAQLYPLGRLGVIRWFDVSVAANQIVAMPANPVMVIQQPLMMQVFVAPSLGSQVFQYGRFGAAPSTQSILGQSAPNLVTVTAFRDAPMTYSIQGGSFPRAEGTIEVVADDVQVITPRMAVERRPGDDLFKNLVFDLQGLFAGPVTSMVVAPQPKEGRQILKRIPLPIATQDTRPPKLPAEEIAPVKQPASGGQDEFSVPDFDPSRSDLVRVPECEEQALEDGAAKLKVVGLVPQIPNQLAFPVDIVVQQRPKAGTKVPQGTEVRLSPIVAIVPDLIGMTQADAISLLQQERFNPVYDKKILGTHEVTDQKPKPGERLQRGQQIAIASMVTVPSVLNLAVAKAKTTIENTSLNVRFTTKTIASDFVARQTPRAGTRVYVGTTVNLVPGLVVPQLVGKPVAEANDLLKAVRLTGSIVNVSKQFVTSFQEPIISQQSVAGGTRMTREDSLRLGVRKYTVVREPPTVIIAPTRDGLPRNPYYPRKPERPRDPDYPRPTAPRPSKPAGEDSPRGGGLGGGGAF